MFEKKLAGMQNRAIEPIAIHEEAMRLNHVVLDTEHLLLALIHRGRGVAVRRLLELGVNLEELEKEVMAMINKSSLSLDVERPLEFTSAANQVLQYAVEEAQKVESNCVYIEYILLGLIREKNGIAAKALANFGVTLERVQELLDPRPILKLSRKQLYINDVDREIRDLVYLLNEVPFLETSSSCSGHPKPHIPPKEWHDGGINVDATGDVGQVFSVLELIRARLDNTRGLELSRRAKLVKETPHVKRTYVDRTLTLFKQVDGEALYTSAIPIMTTYFWSLIGLSTTISDELPLIWNTVNRITQEFISYSEILPPIKTPEAAGETFVRLLQSVPHIREIVAYNRQSPSRVGVIYRGGADIYFLWNRAAVQWGWDFMNHLKTQLEDELDKNRIGGFRTSFVIRPIVKRNNLQRTREDHLKIWKLIELAVAEGLAARAAMVYHRAARGQAWHRDGSCFMAK